MRGLAMAGRCMKFFEANTRIFASPLTWRESFGGAYKFHGNLVPCEYLKHHKWNDSQDFGVLLIAKLGRSCSTNTAVQLNVHKKQIIPASPPPRADEIASLYQFVQGSQKLAILTGAGVSTESGIPDYRSPNGAYSTGFKPITHQEFVRSERSRRRYWARSYAGWQRFISAQPGPTHRAIAQLESRGYVESIITQNVDRLHHCAGSNPLELHGTTHEVICLSCSDLTSRLEFQDRVKELNPEWALAMEALENGEAVSNVGMQQRPDGDIEIDERFWEGKFQVPICKLCGGLLKPNVVLFGDNLPKSRAETALAMVNSADALLVVGSSLMVLSAFRLAKTAHEKGIPFAIINVGPTRADALASLKIECRSGEILSRVLDCGSLGVPHVAVDPHTDMYTKVVPN